MYLNHWKLKRRPFDDRFDPREFFAAGSHKQVLTQLSRFVREGRALAVLAGGAGAGKSTVVAVLNDDLDTMRHPVVWVRVAPCFALDVLRETTEQLQDPADRRRIGASSLADLSVQLQNHLLHRRTVGQHPVLFVDAADNLCDRELRSLINASRQFEIDGSPAITVVLVGSCELLLKARRLSERYDQPIAHWILDPLAASETRVYVEQRVRRAGGDHSIFSKGALELLHELSGGVPRRINRLCDLCLLTAFAQECEQIAENHVWAAQTELRLFGSTRTAMLPATHRWRRIQRSSC